MATVQDLLSQKNGKIIGIGPDATVIAAADLMNEHHIGSLLVTEDDRLIGIFTERDILRRVVGARRDPEETRVGEVMTREVVCCRRHTTIDEARGVMKNRRIRHMPVLNEDGTIEGLISIGDLNAYQNNHQEMTIHLLEQYIYGQV